VRQALRANEGKGCVPARNRIYSIWRREAMRRPNGWYALLGFGAAVAGAAWLGAWFGPRDLRTGLWYARLKKPAYNPPNAVFPIAWSILYTLMAASGWRIWRAKDSAARTRALELWAAQLAVNAAWAPLFFGRHQPKYALADVITLEAIILAYIATAKEVDCTAAACFVPYGAWAAFATLLNAEIVVRNPRAERMLPRAA
jgi:tryptophan-rich sensory protein